ncbi:MAG: DUF4154 domain-containing protein [Myxococcaceae bacterium]|nr:DUF4154 domain-containing protein [Myxococcaceae bacterium]
MRALLLVLLFAPVAAQAAESEELPTELQAQLLSKMTTYVKGLAPAGATSLKVLVVYPGAADSPPTRAATAMVDALSKLGQMGTYKVDVKPQVFTDERALQAALATEKPQVVYVTGEHTTKSLGFVVAAVKSVGGVVSVSGTPSHVEQGVVLGFGAAEGRPRVLVNLKQAREQGVSFHNGLLRYAVIVEQ